MFCVEKNELVVILLRFGEDLQTFVQILTFLQSNTRQSRTTSGFKRRSINGRVGLRVQRTVLKEKGNRYKKRGKPRFGGGRMEADFEYE